MTTTLLDKPKCLHREEQPVRECERCGAYLRTGNLSTTCDPCGVPPWEEVDLTLESVFSIAATFSDTRKPIFDALLECMEQAA
jgi:hypothetical protein